MDKDSPSNIEFRKAFVTLVAEVFEIILDRGITTEKIRQVTDRINEFTKELEEIKENKEISDKDNY